MSLPYPARRLSSYAALTPSRSWPVDTHSAGPSNTREVNEPESRVHDSLIISQPLRQENDYQVRRGFSTSPSRLVPSDSPRSSVPSHPSDYLTNSPKDIQEQHEVIHVEAAPQQRVEISSSPFSNFRRIQAGSSSRNSFPPIQPRTSASITSRRSRPNRKLRNRDYYPSIPHQTQFDELEQQDPAIYQKREREGLNSLDGDLDQTPQYVMPGIIECAILGSPQHKLTLSELRTTLKRRFRYYEMEEERGAKSWERTLLQNLSKKERFVNIERPEPGQGGYWTLNHDAPPSNRTRKPISRHHRHRTGSSHSNSIRYPLPGSLDDNIKRSLSPERKAGSPPSVVTVNRSITRSSDLNLNLQLNLDLYDDLKMRGRGELGGPSSHFRYAPTQRWPDGRLMGRHEMTLQLPKIVPKSIERVVPTSPRHFSFTMTTNSATQVPTRHIANFMLQGSSEVTSPSSEPFTPTLPPLWS